MEEEQERTEQIADGRQQGGMGWECKEEHTQNTQQTRQNTSREEREREEQRELFKQETIKKHESRCREQADNREGEQGEVVENKLQRETGEARWIREKRHGKYKRETASKKMKDREVQG